MTDGWFIVLCLATIFGSFLFGQCRVRRIREADEALAREFGEGTP